MQPSRSIGGLTSQDHHSLAIEKSGKTGNTMRWTLKSFIISI